MIKITIVWSKSDQVTIFDLEMQHELVELVDKNHDQNDVNLEDTVLDKENLNQVSIRKEELVELVDKNTDQNDEDTVLDQENQESVRDEDEELVVPVNKTCDRGHSLQLVPNDMRDEDDIWQCDNDNGYL